MSVFKYVISLYVLGSNNNLIISQGWFYNSKDDKGKNTINMTEKWKGIGGCLGDLVLTDSSTYTPILFYYQHFSYLDCEEIRI